MPDFAPLSGWAPFQKKREPDPLRATDTRKELADQLSARGVPNEFIAAHLPQYSDPQTMVAGAKRQSTASMRFGRNRPRRHSPSPRRLSRQARQGSPNRSAVKSRPPAA